MTHRQTTYMWLEHSSHTCSRASRECSRRVFLFPSFPAHLQGSHVGMKLFICSGANLQGMPQKHGREYSTGSDGYSEFQTSETAPHRPQTILVAKTGSKLQVPGIVPNLQGWLRGNFQGMKESVANMGRALLWGLPLVAKQVATVLPHLPMHLAAGLLQLFTFPRKTITRHISKPCSSSVEYNYVLQSPATHGK